MDEVLAGGVANAGGVVRSGAEVHRPANAHSAAIHRFLASLAAAGFDGASVPLGIEGGRERLVFVAGDVPVPPYPPWAQDDAALASIARLLQRFHDASRGFDASVTTWSTEMQDPAGANAIGAVMCHNDVCLENVVFRAGNAVTLLDFDFAAPGRPIYDVAQMARMCIPIDDDANAARLGWEPVDRPGRLRLVADEYGLDARAGRTARDPVGVDRARRRVRSAPGRSRGSELRPHVGRDGWRGALRTTPGMVQRAARTIRERSPLISGPAGARAHARVACATWMKCLGDGSCSASRRAPAWCSRGARDSPAGCPGSSRVMAVGRATGRTRAVPKAPTCSRRSSTSSSTCRRTTPTTRTSACSAAATATSVHDGVPTNSNPDPAGNDVRVFHAPETCQPGRGVSQSWTSTHRQIDGGRMDGFLLDGNTNAMKYWDGSDLPFYWSLASTFPICDRWFASAPAQTYPNRMYLQAATSQDLVSTDVARAFAMPHPAGGTIWEKLSAHGISWHDYAWDLPDIALFPKVWNANKDKVRTFDQFLADCRAGHAPDRLDREPRRVRLHGGEPGRHPARRGVQLVDHQRGDGEPGVAEDGAAVHVRRARRLLRPRAAAGRGAARRHRARTSTRPRARPRRGTSTACASRPSSSRRSRRRNYVSHVVHDHTSVLRFIETKFNLGALTRRDANASNLLDCFDFRRAPAFLEPPLLAAPGLPATGSTCTPEIPPPPTQPAAVTAFAAAPVAGLGTASAAHATFGTNPEKADPNDQRVALLRQLAGAGASTA